MGEMSKYPLKLTIGNIPFRTEDGMRDCFLNTSGRVSKRETIRKRAIGGSHGAHQRGSIVKRGSREVRVDEIGPRKVSTPEIL